MQNPETPFEYTLLIIEDQPEVARLLAKILRPTYGIYMANNAEEGFLCLVQNKIDLILLDVSLPGRSGLEFCETVKSDLHLRRTPIIIVTGLRTLEDKLKGFQKGADDYLSKPFLTEELLARIEAVLRRNRIAQETALQSHLTEKELVERAAESETIDIEINISPN